MLFNSVEFIFFLLPVILFYYLVPARYRWILLLAASYFFYMSWHPEYGLLLLFSTLVDYYAGIRMGALPDRRGRRLIARNVAEEIQGLYPHDFIPYEKEAGRTHFYNNCEGVIRWDNMETRTDTRAFEGRYSSYTGPETPFSLTFHPCRSL